jgi:anti-anti-sigma regulatory factor
MLRIDVRQGGTSSVSVALSGDFLAGEVPEIDRLLEEATRSGARVAIDLSAVRRVDREVVRFLAFGGGRGAHLVGCPAYVREWMRCEAM